MFERSCVFGDDSDDDNMPLATCACALYTRGSLGAVEQGFGFESEEGVAGWGRVSGPTSAINAHIGRALR